MNTLLWVLRALGFTIACYGWYCLISIVLNYKNRPPHTEKIEIKRENIGDLFEDKLFEERSKALAIFISSCRSNALPTSCVSLKARFQFSFDDGQDMNADVTWVKNPEPKV